MLKSLGISFILLICAQWGSSAPKARFEENPETIAGYFEGDILIDPKLGRNALTHPEDLWPNKTLYFKIMPEFTASEIETIYGAMQAIAYATSCIRFLPATPDMHAYVSFTSRDEGCSSLLGYKDDVQPLNLQKPGCIRDGVIVHELLHALGLTHQQNVVNRDDYVKIIWENIKDYKGLEFKINNFTYDYGLPYDYDSIMHYGETFFGKEGPNGEQLTTIVPSKPGVKIGKRSEMSLLDIHKLKMMYNCF